MSLASTTKNLVQRVGSLVGLDLSASARRRREMRVFDDERRRFVGLLGSSAAAGAFPMELDRPYMRDRLAAAGAASGHYFHQDLFVAQCIADDLPERHIDVGSRIDGFVAHVASFREIEVFDIRPMPLQVRNVSFRQRDLMQPAPELDCCCDSLSCLHALEHFGLGRYGDQLDPDGWKVAWAHLDAMVRAGGRLYLATPIGPQRIEFNAHRVFAVPTLVELFKAAYEVEQFAYVDDAGDLHTDARLDSEHARQSFGCTYGCGIFALRKRRAGQAPAP